MSKIEDLMEQLTGIGQDIETEVKSDVREGLAAGISEQFLTNKNRKTYEGKTPDQSIEHALAEFPTMTDPRLQAMLGRIRFDGGVTDDFKAGLLFAVKLIADSEYDY